MKKLYRKGTVHPSPPQPTPQKPADVHLSILPATILTLTVALSPEEKQVLSYLISCSNFSCIINHKSSTRSSSSSTSYNSSSCVDHPPSFNCYCFRCYMSFWVKWDSSPNRQLIHEIIDAYEDGLTSQNKKEKSKKERRKSRRLKKSQLTSPSNKDKFITESENSMEEFSVVGRERDDHSGEEEEEEEIVLDKGSVRRFVSFLGEKIWGVWT